ncbi:MAG: Pseudomurein-binding repeat protein [Candidatus Tokpelaia hoelldobleri]|uniref:Pseudomurein-binding repeat protein n=1 Tax=Candidatus Tokpelaia hoelldobleri TaxID=1902579 RepID=A0A1U9JT13_9HYPH|nr:MAG: Pseudomurein-binding repeat protein [Candidatus Tokpelaia hoelldoblerii]
MTGNAYIPAVQLTMAQSGVSKIANELGMRPMQERAYAQRGEQYLLIKSPPASGKSRALMFIALDKLHNQGIKKAIICVPERSIGGSFADQPLSKYGFFADWVVEPCWNLCNAPDNNDVAKSKVQAVGMFLTSEATILVCTHATFRFAFDELGAEAFDDCMIAIDEFHHVSADSANNRLGRQLGELIERDKTHIVAMTGSYFRGDSVPVLTPEDEQKFASVTYTYYEQLNGYEYLKELKLGYYFYNGRYLDAIMRVLNPDEKTIIHIPNVNARESTKDKHREVEEILDGLGIWQGVDPHTGFQLVQTADGRVLKIADLVDDVPEKRDHVIASLKDSTQADNRGHVDMIIALGMAKEGFDWVWCQHALTVGYRSSLTEIVQIIGRATRDAKGKTTARFTNLIAEPDASDERVKDAVNDTLKAIAASLLMEQVLAPKFQFTPKNNRPLAGYDYGENGYDPTRPNVGFCEESGQLHMELNGLREPKSKEAHEVIEKDLNELVADFVSDKQPAVAHGLFNSEIVPEQLTIEVMGKIVRDRYPHMDAEDQEAIRQHAIAAFSILQQAKANKVSESDGQTLRANTALLDGVRKFALDVKNLDVDMIDRVNPFLEAYAILSKTMNETTLKQLASIITARKINMTHEEARLLVNRALKFKQERGRVPDLKAQDPWEQRMAEGIAWLQRHTEKNNHV